MYCIHFPPHWSRIRIIFSPLRLFFLIRLSHFCLLLLLLSFTNPNFEMNGVKCLLVLQANLQNWLRGLCVCVWFNPLKSLAGEITHACGSTRRHTTLTYAGNDTAERECGIVEGFGAGGWQLFALLIFDLTWPRRTRRPSDQRRPQL